MKKIYAIFILFFVLCACTTGQKKNEIVVCGDDKVWIVNVDNSEGKNLDIVWKWNAQESNIPDDFKKHFRGMDECKTAQNGNWILMSSSAGGAAIIERSSEKCLFYARVPAAHSIELLPNNRVVVALSHNEEGDCIQLFDINRPNQVLFQDSLFWGHGVIWMENRQLLYALGFNELKAYSLKDWESNQPALQMEKVWKLPTDDGHDLIRISENELGFTTSFGTYVINLDTEKIIPFQPLEGKKFIKSFNYNKKNRTLSYTQAEIEWWTHNIYLENPKKTLTIDSINLYKVRPVIYE
jgi:hypothetical protein|nr:DUF6528 family protein [uncultured Bacteroides sp.]